MTRTTVPRVAVLVLIFLACRSVHAQESHAGCRAMKYENYNQIDYTLRVSSVRGSARLPDGFPIWHGCVGIFSEVSEKLVQFSEIDSEGRFEITGLTNGKYRLVISLDGFCAANTILILKNKRASKKLLSATMKPRGIDDCSYIELK